jgi:hypothetical protein
MNDWCAYHRSRRGGQGSGRARPERRTDRRESVDGGREIVHCGHTIRFHRTLVGWIGQIRKTGVLAFTNDGLVTATLEEGEFVLVARARARIERSSS